MYLPPNVFHPTVSTSKKRTSTRHDNDLIKLHGVVDRFAYIKYKWCALLAINEKECIYWKAVGVFCLSPRLCCAPRPVLGPVVETELVTRHRTSARVISQPGKE
jgi:hypothetical protein